MVGIRGVHVLLEYHGCCTEILTDETRIEEIMLAAVQAAGATVVRAFFHRFSPHGVSGVVVIAESHLSIHTWPEVGYASVDFYTCGDCQPHNAVDVLSNGLSASRVDCITINRGLETSPSLGIAECV